MSKEIEEALRAFDAAGKKLGGTLRSGGAGAEKAYATAYAKLVRLGVRPQLRGKYRTA